MAEKTVSKTSRESNKEASCPDKLDALDCIDRLNFCADKLDALTNMDFEALEGTAATGLQIFLMELHTEIEKISEGFYNEWRDLNAQLQAFQEKEAAHA